MIYSFELGPIRPPSEAFSLLIRVTRNCSWNRCAFCHTYKGEKFQIRSVAEIKQDISAVRAMQQRIEGISNQCEGSPEEAVTLVPFSDDLYRNVALWLHGGGRTAFLQDANTLIMRTGELAEVIRFLKETLPGITRVTSYARSKTALKKSLEELIELREAGLSRLHIGLETGYDPLLQYMDKGVTADEHIAAGKKVVASGISLSEYVILGLGGKKMWHEHALHTAHALNEINPDYIRVRTLVVSDSMPLYSEVEKGNFVRQTDDEILEEEKLLIEHLECESNFVSDHITNLLMEIEGKLPQDKEKLLAVISRYQALTPAERANFRVGRRMGLYSTLDDLKDARRHEVAEQAARRLGKNGEVDETMISKLMEGFI